MSVIWHNSTAPSVVYSGKVPQSRWRQAHWQDLKAEYALHHQEVKQSEQPFKAPDWDLTSGTLALLLRLLLLDWENRLTIGVNQTAFHSFLDQRWSFWWCREKIQTSGETHKILHQEHLPLSAAYKGINLKHPICFHSFSQCCLFSVVIKITSQFNI